MRLWPEGVLAPLAGDPARVRAPVFARPDVIEQYRRDFGIDRPLLEQLGSFLWGAIRVISASPSGFRRR